MAKLLCPYCFSRFTSEQMQFRCVNPTGDCPMVLDVELSRFVSDGSPPVPKPRTFTPPRPFWPGVPRSAMCSCRYETRLKLCPHCHNEWPTGLESTENLIIAVIGAKDVGKSHYIAVLINTLTNDFGVRFRASLNAVDDRTRTRYAAEFRKHVYEEKTAIPTTRAARTYPLIYRLVFEEGTIYKSLRVVTLVFFDTAGENFTTTNTLNAHNRYMASASGILFLLDPLQIPAVQSRLAGKRVFPEERTNPIDVVSRTDEVIRNVLGLDIHKRIRIPVALTFSKLDAIRELLPRGSVAHRDCIHQGVLNLTDQEQMNETMRTHVAQWVGTGLEQLVSQRFAEYAYFGVSALGCAPDEHGRIAGGVAPFRIEDPFLWLLYRMRVIDGQRRKTA